MSVERHYRKQVGPGFRSNNPSAIGIGQVLVGHARYDFAVDGGAVGTITPAQNCTIPDNAIIIESIINPNTDLVGTTGNISFGLDAGAGGTAALLALTARGSLVSDAIFQGKQVQSASGANSVMTKLTAAAQVTITIATNALTSGAADIFVLYVVPRA